MSQKREPASVTVKVVSCGVLQVNGGFCESNTHVFTETPGTCQCGAEHWEDDPPERHLRLV